MTTTPRNATPWSRRWVRVLAVLVGLVGLGAAVVWRIDPSNRIERQFGAIGMPASFHLTHEDRPDSGWGCFDDCPTGYRYWASDLSEEATVTALTAALSDARVAVLSGELCLDLSYQRCHYSDTWEWVIQDVHWQASLRGRIDGHVTVGRRVDGRVGIEIWFEAG